MTFFQKLFGDFRENKQKSNAPRTRQLHLEPLESREFLSVNPLSAGDYNSGIAVAQSNLSQVASAPSTVSQNPAKNIILMIGDGMGFNTAQLGMLGNPEVASLFNNMFPVSLGVTTYAAADTGYNLATAQNFGYDPARYWSGTPANRRETAGGGTRTTDSEQAITAIVTGKKISGGGVSYESRYAPVGPLTNIADIARNDFGMMTGAVTTVPASHATPAGVGAHQSNRDLYKPLFAEMIRNLDVVFGGGDPTAPPDGVTTYFVDSATGPVWTSLVNGTPISGTTYELLRTKADFQAYANGTKDWADSTKDKMVGVFNSVDSRYDTLRVFGQSAYDALPNLTDMSLAALNILNTSNDGFFVMLEGGGIDWAAHAHVSNGVDRPDLLLNEVDDYMNAVLAVYQWITDNDMWEDTLLIVTADHETGDIWSASGVLGVPTRNNVAGTFGNHTNALVPMWAAGAGSDLFADYVYGKDRTAAGKWNVVAGFNDWDGSYIDNTDIFKVMVAALNREAPIPTPSLDITGNGTFDTRDVNLLLRYIFHYSDGALTHLLTTQSAAEVKAYLDENIMLFDIDGDGEVNAADANLLLRYLFNYRGDGLTQTLVGNNSTRVTSEAIVAYIESVLPGKTVSAAPVIAMSPIMAAPIYEVSGPTDGELYEKSLSYWEFSADTASSGPIRDWVVSWGDGSEDTQILGGPRSRISVAHFFREPGTYTITASTTDFFGISMTATIGTYTVQARVETEQEFALQEQSPAVFSTVVLPEAGKSRIEFTDESASETMRLRQMLDLDQSGNFGLKSGRVADMVFAEDELFDDEWFDFSEERSDFWSEVFEDELLAF
ncbi:MAG: alkaline phosphatase [Planctomycetaceae bacterium]|nr:alkaline phosphatase [Planctomycetaceae bacterium]